MKKLTNSQMKSIKAGTNMTGTMLSAILRSGTILIEIGRYAGSGIRRLVYNQLCGF